MDTGRDVRALPKAELHVHLPAAMRPDTLAELAAESGLAAPDPRGFTSFVEFQQVFAACFAVTQTRPDNLRRLVREMVADAADDGVVWLQPHVDPRIFAAFGPPEQVLELLLDTGRDAGRRYGVGFGLTFGASRHADPADVVELARLAARYASHGVHALGLTGDERLGPVDPYAEAFAIARDAGLTAAPHAGELWARPAYAPRSRRSARRGSRTASVRSRTPPWSTCSSTAASASTSARPPTGSSAWYRIWPGIRCRGCWPPAYGARSAPTTRSCSVSAWPTSTGSRGTGSA